MSAAFIFGPFFRVLSLRSSSTSPHAPCFRSYTPPTPSPSQTPSQTASQTQTPSPTSSLSAGASPSMPVTPSITASVLPSSTATLTSSATPFPACNTLFNNTVLRKGFGLSGSFPIRAPRPGNAAWSAASTCPGGSMSTIPLSPLGTDMYQVDLAGFAVGGSLVVSSCGNPNFPDTIGGTGDNALWVFRRCPAGGLTASWGCVASNDQGGTVPFSCVSLAQVTMTTNQSVYWVAVAGWSATSVWASGLWWT